MTLLAVRLAGGALILTACTYAGIMAEGRLKRRWMFFEELCELFGYLERETVYHRTPLDEALSLAAERCRTELKKVLLDAAEGVKKKTGGDFSEIWEKAVRRELDRGIFAEETIQVILLSSKALCNPDVVLQKELISQYARRFAQMEADAEEDYRSKGGLFRKLGTAAGIFLILLLM